MMIEFYNDKGELLVSYDTFRNNEEIEATKEFLEYENNCIITVKKAD